MTSVSNFETAYLQTLNDLLAIDDLRQDRTGTGTRSLFGRMMRHDLSLGLPLLTTKKLHIKSIVGELLWFLRGQTSTDFLKENGISIWDEWALDGQLGPVYGAQWRFWKSSKRVDLSDPNAQALCDALTLDGYERIGLVYGAKTQQEAGFVLYEKQIDQVQAVIDGIQNKPTSRRHIINAWNVADLPDERLSPHENVKRNKMALAPCHVMYQFYVSDGKLSCMMTQRSQDIFLGCPYNMSSVAFLTHMIAQQCDLGVGEVIMSVGDQHLYANHVDQAREQITRDSRPLPTLRFARKPASIFDYRIEDFIVEGYDAHPNIKAPVAV